MDSNMGSCLRLSIMLCIFFSLLGNAFAELVNSSGQYCVGKAIHQLGAAYHDCYSSSQTTVLPSLASTGAWWQQAHSEARWCIPFQCDCTTRVMSPGKRTPLFTVSAEVCAAGKRKVHYLCNLLWKFQHSCQKGASASKRAIRLSIFRAWESVKWLDPDGFCKIMMNLCSWQVLFETRNSLFETDCFGCRTSVDQPYTARTVSI